MKDVLEAGMEWGWLSLTKLLDPGTKIGAVALFFIIGFFTWAICVITTRILQQPNWVVGRLKRKVDESVIIYTVKIKNMIILVFAAMFYASLVPGLRALVGTLVAGAGITALIVGFAAKSTLANIIAGISLIIYRPLRIGDKVSIDGEYSTVEDVTMRHTIVRTWQNKRLIIPNSKLDEMTLVNYSIIDHKMKCTVDVGISYDTDIDLARRLLLESANACPHRDTTEEEPWVRVTGHEDFAVRLRLYLWASDADESWSAKFWLLEDIKKRFDREGVEIPFPYRTVVYKKDLPAPRQSEPDR